MKDLFVRRAYTKQGITIVVDLDFINKTVSLVEKDGAKKKWMFTERTPEYLNGWLLILKAMEYAVTEAKKEMAAITKQEHDQFIKMYMALDQPLKVKGKKS